MKSRTPIIIAIFTIISFSSCIQKEYTCVCQGGIFSSYYEEISIKANSEDNARNRCLDKNDLSKTASNVSCDLKK